MREIPVICEMPRNISIHASFLYRGVKLSVQLNIFLGKKNCVIFIGSSGASRVGGKADILIHNTACYMFLLRVLLFAGFRCTSKELKLPF